MSERDIAQEEGLAWLHSVAPALEAKGVTFTWYPVNYYVRFVLGDGTRIDWWPRTGTWREVTGEGPSGYEDETLKVALGLGARL